MAVRRRDRPRAVELLRDCPLGADVGTWIGLDRQDFSGGGGVLVRGFFLVSRTLLSVCETGGGVNERGRYTFRLGGDAIKARFGGGGMEVCLAARVGTEHLFS